MPCILPSNNRTLPPNARASDNASFAVENIADVQQQKMMAAFRVQGIRSCIYHHLNSGIICSCQGKNKKINERLDKDGKAPVGLINNILQGGDYGIYQYNTRTKDGIPNGDSRAEDLGEEYPFIASDPDSDVYSMSGFVNEDDTDEPDTSLDEMIGEYDVNAFGLTDVSCPICYGTGFVGGYSLFRGYRKVIPCEDFKISGELHIENSPFSAYVETLSCEVVLPKGAVGVDAFRLLNNQTVLYGLCIDTIPISYPVILAKCDGKKHILTASFSQPQEVTHIEIQLNLSNESSYIELPKLNKTGDRNLLDSTSPFQILLSPDVPYIDTTDIIVESMWGKALLVQDYTWMNTRNRQMFGYEINVRPIQPAELYYLLPKRMQIRQQNTTTNPVLGNIGRRP